MVGIFPPLHQSLNSIALIENCRGLTMKGSNYRVGRGQPYVRKKFIHGQPVSKIAKFTIGNTKATFTHRVLLLPLKKVQIRHNALESTRVAVNKVLFDRLGENGYVLKIRVFPHIVLRENKMMAFAGADRLQEGMRRSFGKPAGLAARVNLHQPIVEVGVNENGLEAAKEAFRRGTSKLPTTCMVEITTNTAPVKTV
ncbi:MAG: 50S ribosomal protein L16 [Candidatus Bathyarchaeota archaeon]